MQELFASLVSEKIDMERQSRIRRQALWKSSSEEIPSSNLKKGAGRVCRKIVVLWR